MGKKARPSLVLDTKFSKMCELPSWLDSVYASFDYKGKPRKEEKYLNCPMSFDIETTSYRNIEGEKRGCMYIWMVSIFGKAFFGRTWAEFHTFCSQIVEHLHTNKTNRAVLYVHNLSFEFGFIENLFEWEKVFCTDYRKVIYALTTDGIEFRCSYFLYGLSLENMGKYGLTKYKVEKASGDLDYSLIRHSETQLSPVEMGYCLNDVQVVVAFIEEQIQSEKTGIVGIPLTKTGYPRRRMKKAMLYGKDGFDNRKWLSKLTLEVAEFRLLQDAFAGGFTHASHNHAGKTLICVGSQDFTSSYPYSLMLPYYPISKGEAVEVRTIEQLRLNMKHFCCLMQVRFYGIREKVTFEHILSYSKCKLPKGVELDNGRIISADEITIALTEIDFEMLEQFYEWDKIEVLSFYRYRRGYLPKAFILTLLELFYNKQVFKYDVEMQQLFMRSKADLNAMYGVCVTNPCRDEITYSVDNGWTRTMTNYAEEIEKYNEKKSRFISYPWGVWCTAVARRNLISTILKVGEDYVYSDTDSLKYLHPDKHQHIFEEYNKEVLKKLHAMCDFYHIPYDAVTIDGKTIGVFDNEGTYLRFKTLGAKRYCYQKNGHFSLTISGVNKKVGSPWLNINNEDPFEAFNEGLIFPKGFAGKLTHTYSDEGFRDILTDYLGNTAIIQESSFVHLEEAEYSLSLTDEYRSYINSMLGD